MIAARMRAEGIDLRLGARAERVARYDDGYAVAVQGSEQDPLRCDQILAATGRTPRTEGLALETVAVNTRADGAVVVDSRLRTTAPSIFAVGDVTGLLPFTHVAAHHARVATPNALFHTRSTVDDVIPWVTFTDPEVARVGLTEQQARERWGDRVSIAAHDYSTLDRAITSGEAYGFAKLVAGPRRRLVGATVAAPASGEAIAELTAWVSRGAKLDAVSQTVHAYPTLAEGPARAADAQLAARYSSPSVRALARPFLAAMRALERTR
jgi:pyruvate/2-oxoglutarate dehydrogenase complex dihydrolipoamide dehydrogenase (E3) component